MADTNLENMELFPEGNVSAHFSQNPKAGKAANKSPNIANKIGGGYRNTGTEQFCKR